MGTGCTDCGRMWLSSLLRAAAACTVVLLSPLQALHHCLTSKEVLIEQSYTIEA